MKFNQRRLKTQEDEQVIYSDFKSGVLKMHHNKKVFTGKKLKTLDCQVSTKIALQRVTNTKNLAQYINQDIDVNSLFCKRLSNKKSILIIKKPEYRKISIQMPNSNYKKGYRDMDPQIISKTNNIRRSSMKQNNLKHDRVRSNLWQHKQIIKSKKPSASDRLDQIQLRSKKITQQLSIKQLVQPLQINQVGSQNLHLNKNEHFNSGSLKMQVNQSVDLLNSKGHKRFQTQNIQSKSMDLNSYIPRSKQKQLARQKRGQTQAKTHKLIKMEDIKFNLGPWITKPNRYQKQFNNFFN